MINGEAKAQQEALRTQDASTDGFLWPDDSFGDRLISTTPSGREGARTFSTPSFLAIFARYADDMYWLEEENTGMMDNSTGTPHFIMPMVVYQVRLLTFMLLEQNLPMTKTLPLSHPALIYYYILEMAENQPLLLHPLSVLQSSDIGPKGQPVFPGLPSNPTPSDVDAMPSWPKWAWKYIIQKNSTRDRAFPGSFQEAELRTKLRLGLPLHIPRQREEWEAIESRLGAIKAGEKVAEDMIASITGLDDGVPQEQAGGNGDGGTAKEAADNQEESKKSSSTSVSHASSPKSSNDTSAAADLLQELQSIAQNSSFASTVLAPRVSSVHKLHLVPNRGAEAMPYLTGIIEHYDNLPEIVLFMHGHRLAWHMVLAQDFTMRRLVRFPPKNFTSFNGYMPLGCLERWRNDISQIFPTDIDANWASNNGPRWHEALAARYAQVRRDPWSFTQYSL